MTVSPASRRSLLGWGTAALLSGCALPTRLPAIPGGSAVQASVLGVPNERFMPSQGIGPLEREVMDTLRRSQVRRGGVLSADAAPLRLLAVSGGGEDGAFGAGLLCGWTEHGDRPAFDVVTGVSTGALTAPFAFLGPDHDSALRDVYTDISARDVLRQRSLTAAVFDDALADTAPLFGTISRHLTEAMLADLATAYHDGRLLLIGTTDLDAQLPVIWNIGAIAASSHPKALDLIRRILLASAAIPGAFPPVMIDVTLDGARYQEMHVDGGAVAQAFLYPSALTRGRRARMEAGQPVLEIDAYVIRNARLDPQWASVNRRTMGIVSRAISTMIFSSGYNDVLRMYYTTRQDDVDFNLAFIRPDFTGELQAPFDQSYMRALFDYGFQQGRAGYRWAKIPPGVDGGAPPPPLPAAVGATS